MVALSAPLQIRLMDIAHKAASMAAASNHAAFKLANALEPWFGGMAISAGFGWTSTGYIGAVTALVGLGVYLIARKMNGGDLRPRRQRVLLAQKKCRPLQGRRETYWISASRLRLVSID